MAPFLSLLPGRALRHSTRTTAGDFCRSSLTASRRSLQPPSTAAGGLRAALRAHQPVRTIPGGTSTRQPPPPFIIPAAVCHYTPPPPPCSFPLTGPAMCQWLAVHLPPRQYQGLPHLLAARKGDGGPRGWAGEESLAHHSKSRWERGSPLLSCCTKDSLRDQL